jgi:hypothetical protein
MPAKWSKRLRRRGRRAVIGASMKKTFAILLSFGVVISSLAAEAGKSEVKLFDGKTFAGWEGDTNKTFRIVDGAIVAGTLKEKIARNEFLCTTRPYRDFELKLKFKLVGEGANAGIQFRTRRIPNHHEVSGYQADMGDPNWWGCLYDESRRNKVLAQAPVDKVKGVLKKEDWNDYTIRAEGKRIQLWINGLKTVDYTETDANIDESGIIAVQIHGGPPSEAWYKDIRIKEL